MADLADIGIANLAETKPDWRAGRPSLYMPATQSGYALPRDPVTGAQGQFVAPVISTLMQWGPHIQFQVWPLNYHEMDHETSTAWAVKPIVGAANYREWVGELDEVRTLRGRIFPYRIGGMTEVEIMDAYRRGGIVNLMVDGASRDLGWYVLEKHSRSHTRISAEGIGQMIEFSAVRRVPQPDPRNGMRKSRSYSSGSEGLHERAGI